MSYVGDFALVLPMLIRHQWRGQSARGRPSDIQSMADRVSVESDALGPLDERQGFSLEGQSPIAALVACLRVPNGPSAVLGRVRTVIVDAVNRMPPRWARPHIVVEVRERDAPAVTDSYPASAVIWKGCASHVETPLAHSIPCVPFWTDAGFSRHTVRSSTLAYLLSAKAATTGAASVAKRGAIDGPFGATVTSTEPQGLMVAVASWYLTFDNQRSEAAA